MVNNPLPKSLSSECRKAARTLNAFIKPDPTSKIKNPDMYIPSHILQNARGLAIITVLKAGFIWSGRVGSGIVIARTADGQWSAPSAIGTGGVGVGGQIGVECTDFIFVLNSKAAVKAFSHGGNLTLGANLSVAAGPLGRNAEAAGTLGNLAAVYSYSKTRGLFAGVSLEGSVIIERKDANTIFYGRKVSASELLSGSVPRPASAQTLYAALDLRTQTQSFAEDNLDLDEQENTAEVYQPPPYVPQIASYSASASDSKYGALRPSQATAYIQDENNNASRVMNSYNTPSSSKHSYSTLTPADDKFSTRRNSTTAGWSYTKGISNEINTSSVWKSSQFSPAIVSYKRPPPPPPPSRLQ